MCIRDRMGITTITDKDNKVLGVITDGDLRRMLIEHPNFQHLKAKDIATMHPKKINKTALAATALDLIRNNSIGQIIVVDDTDKYYGVLDIHSILAEGIE